MARKTDKGFKESLKKLPKTAKCMLIGGNLIELDAGLREAQRVAHKRNNLKAIKGTLVLLEENAAMLTVLNGKAGEHAKKLSQILEKSQKAKTTQELRSKMSKMRAWLEGIDMEATKHCGLDYDKFFRVMK